MSEAENAGKGAAAGATAGSFIPGVGTIVGAGLGGLLGWLFGGSDPPPPPPPDIHDPTGQTPIIQADNPKWKNMYMPVGTRVENHHEQENLPWFYNGQNVPGSYYSRYMDSSIPNSYEKVQRNQLDKLYNMSQGRMQTPSEQAMQGNISLARQTALARGQAAMGGRYNTALARSNNQQAAEIEYETLARSKAQALQERQQALQAYMSGLTNLQNQQLQRQAAMDQNAQAWSQAGLQANQSRQDLANAYWASKMQQNVNRQKLEQGKSIADAQWNQDLWGAGITMGSNLIKGGSMMFGGSNSSGDLGGLGQSNPIKWDNNQQQDLGSASPIKWR